VDFDIDGVYLSAFDARELSLVEVWKMFYSTKSVTFQYYQTKPYRVFIISFFLKNINYCDRHFVCLPGLKQLAILVSLCMAVLLYEYNSPSLIGILYN
jgi:hypothetical protein